MSFDKYVNELNCMHYYAFLYHAQERIDSETFTEILVDSLEFDNPKGYVRDELMTIMCDLYSDQEPRSA